MKRTAGIILILSICALFASGALAETKIYTFPTNDVPAQLVKSAINVPKDDVTIRLTFAGDCTLGNEVKFYDYRNTFITKVRENGYDYPFKLWQFLFANDDLTLVNLECTLTDSNNLPRAQKTFLFRGPKDFAKIMPAGSVECVTLENNHILDLGARGQAETIDALRDENVAYVNEDYVTVLEKDGVRVGFTASQFSLTPDKKRSIDAQFEALRSVGCAAIVHNAHMGEEYKLLINSQQKEVAKYVREKGAALLIGHHPHVVQGVHEYEGMLAVYSLGNFSFGGNPHPRDFDAVVASVEMKFLQGEIVSQQLTLWPAEISGSRKRNDYQPMPVNGRAAELIIKKMQKSSGYTLNQYVEGEGAMQPIFLFGKDENDGSE